MTNNNAKIIRSLDGKLFLHTPEYDTVKERLEGKWFQDDKLIRFVSVSVIEYSEDFVEDLAKICSASIMSDGLHQEEETYVAKEICKEMNISWTYFNELLESEIQKVQSSDYNNVYEYLRHSEFGSHTKNGMLLFEASLHIILADGIMTDKESLLLADIAKILSIPTSKVISRIAQFLRFEKEVLVDVDL